MWNIKSAKHTRESFLEIPIIGHDYSGRYGNPVRLVPVDNVYLFEFDGVRRSNIPDGLLKNRYHSSV